MIFYQRMWNNCFLHWNCSFNLIAIQHGILDAYDRPIDGMDKIYSDHTWCKSKTTNIQNEFGMILYRFRRNGHLQCLNCLCEQHSWNEGAAFVSNGWPCTWKIKDSMQGLTTALFILFIVVQKLSMTIPSCLPCQIRVSI